MNFNIIFFESILLVYQLLPNTSRTYPLIDLSHSIIPTSFFAVPPCCMVVQFDSEYGTFLDCNYVFLFSRLRLRWYITWIEVSSTCSKKEPMMLMAWWPTQELFVREESESELWARAVKICWQEILHVKIITCAHWQSAFVSIVVVSGAPYLQAYKPTFYV